MRTTPAQTGLVERPLLGNGHGGCGRRPGETHRWKHRHGAPGRPHGPHAALDQLESMISMCRDRSANLKLWRDGQMALRWCAAGMVEAGKQFRRLNDHLHQRTLRTALDRHVASANVGADLHDDAVTAA